MQKLHKVLSLCINICYYVRVYSPVNKCLWCSSILQKGQVSKGQTSNVISIHLEKVHTACIWKSHLENLEVTVGIGTLERLNKTSQTTSALQTGKGKTL